jgi:AraC-like DNA-binding protein
MTTSTSIKAVAPNYSSDHKQISKNMSFFERIHFWPPNSREIDVFGRCWSLAWFDFPDNLVALHRLGEKIYLNGPVAVFIPPLSIVDFDILGGEISWHAIISDLPTSGWAPTEATLYSRPKELPIPQSLEEVKIFLRDHQLSGAKSTIVEKVEIESGIAKNFRHYLNENFEENLTIEEICKKLNYNPAVLNRAFKKAYEISPINYRIKMRVLDSIHRLVLGDSNVTDIGYDVGFTSSGNFTKQFKKIMKIPPSDYLGKV